MPKIYRVMKKGENGGPALGESATSLGARIGYDIAVGDDGRVHPETGGMSVAPSLSALPLFFVPARLSHLIPGARGHNRNFVWSMGDGPFIDGQVGRGLHFRVDRRDELHGFVEPEVAMTPLDYQDALHATRDAWSEDEE